MLDHLHHLVDDAVRFEVTDDGKRVEGRRVDVPPSLVRELRRGVVADRRPARPSWARRRRRRGRSSSSSCARSGRVASAACSSSTAKASTPCRAESFAARSGVALPRTRSRARRRVRDRARRRRRRRCGLRRAAALSGHAARAPLVHVTGWSERDPRTLTDRAASDSRGARAGRTRTTTLGRWLHSSTGSTDGRQASENLGRRRARSLGRRAGPPPHALAPLWPRRVRGHPRYKRADGKSYIFRLREHIDRLFDTCKMVLLQPKFTREQIMRACVDTLKANALEEGYLRPVVFLGEGAMGIYAPNNPVRATVIAWKWGAYLGEEALKSGIRTKISSFARHHINVSLAKAKMMGQYTNSVLAKREAKFGGYDEAILLDANGYVSEGSGENIFLVKKGVLHHARPLVLDPRGHHARHRHHARARDGAHGPGEPHHARPALARRRGLLHRHRRRDHAGARGRQPHDRRGRRRPRSRRSSRRSSSTSCAAATTVTPSGSPPSDRPRVGIALLAARRSRCGSRRAAPVRADARRRTTRRRRDYADDEASWGKFHSKRFQLTVPLPDGRPGRSTITRAPELVAVHDADRARGSS